MENLHNYYYIQVQQYKRIRYIMFIIQVIRTTSTVLLWYKFVYAYIHFKILKLSLYPFWCVIIIILTDSLHSET